MIKKIKELIEDAEGWRITLETRGSLPQYIDDHQCEISFEGDTIICEKKDMTYEIIVDDTDKGDFYRNFYRDIDGTTEFILDNVLFSKTVSTKRSSSARPSMGNMILNTYVY